MPRRLWAGAQPPSGPFTVDGASPQARGLLVWWPTVRGADNTLRDRAAGGRGDATLTSMPWSPQPVVGGAVASSGGSSGLGPTWPNPADGAISISLWLKWGGSVSNWQTLLAKRSSWGTASMRWSLGFNNTDSGVVWHSASNFGEGWTVTLPATGVWTHLAAVRSGNAGTLYFNGAQVATTTFSAWATGASAPLRLAAVDGGEEFHGSLADIRLYDRALADAEVWQLYDPATRWDLYAPQLRRPLAGGTILVQLLRPASDVSAGLWAPTPSSPATLWDKLDEAAPAGDTDYATSPVPVAADAPFTVALTAGNAPSTAGGRTVRVRAALPSGQSGTQTLRTELLQGTTVIASWDDAVTSTTPATVSHTLTTAEENSITDHTVLRVRCTAVAP